MNNAKKVREMERIYFIDTKENEIDKAELLETHKKYDLMVLRFPIFSDNIPQNLHQYGGMPTPLIYTHTKNRKLISSYVNFFISKIF